MLGVTRYFKFFLIFILVLPTRTVNSITALRNYRKNDECKTIINCLNQGYLTILLQWEICLAI